MTYANLVVNINDIEYVLANLMDSVGLLTTGFCFTLVSFHNASIIKVIEVIKNNCDPGHYKILKERQVFEEYNHIIDILFRIASYYLIPYVCIVCIIPILSRSSDRTSVDSSNDSSVENNYPLPLDLYQLHDINNEVIYFLTYMFIVIILTFNVLIRLNIDFLFVLTVFHLCGQISVLSIRIENLTTSHPKIFQEELIAVINYHHTIIWLSKRMKRIFSFYLASFLLTSTFLLCLTNYQGLANMKQGNSFKAIRCFLCTFIISGMVFVNCLLGNFLVAESGNLERAFYECLWYKTSPAFQKMILVCLMQSQSPLYLSAGGFTVVSLATLTAVMKTTAGYLSLLRAVM
ncbi:odorant receptor 4-like [Diachasma alloeum]|uniref:odorant receptor 4-like n=1 Tax=Diachasma alloeum TaxID=454923 RepID=UPI0010FB9311|nr:odorant receptor 4-like [Diachasma alloeum]